MSSGLVVAKAANTQTERKGGCFGSWESQAWCKRLITPILQFQQSPTPRINQSAPKECVRKTREYWNEVLINPADLIMLSIFAGDSCVELNSSAIQLPTGGKQKQSRLDSLPIIPTHCHNCKHASIKCEAWWKGGDHLINEKPKSHRSDLPFGSHQGMKCKRLLIHLDNLLLPTGFSIYSWGWIQEWAFQCILRAMHGKERTLTFWYDRVYGFAYAFVLFNAPSKALRSIDLLWLFAV